MPLDTLNDFIKHFTQLFSYEIQRESAKRFSLVNTYSGEVLLFNMKHSFILEKKHIYVKQDIQHQAELALAIIKNPLKK